MRRWTNREDRAIIDFTADEGARRTGRSIVAVQQRKTRLRKRPCPFWVWYSHHGEHEMIFCENGNGGHDGTCCGERTIEEYRRLGGTFSYEEEKSERARKREKR